MVKSDAFLLCLAWTPSELYRSSGGFNRPFVGPAIDPEPKLTVTTAFPVAWFAHYLRALHLLYLGLRQDHGQPRPASLPYPLLSEHAGHPSPTGNLLLSEFPISEHAVPSTYHSRKPILSNVNAFYPTPQRIILPNIIRSAS